MLVLKNLKEEIMPKYVYYYNFNEKDLEHLKSLTYIQALEYKIKAAETLLKNLVYVELENRDLTRINFVMKAIKFNKELIEEVKI